MTALLLVTGVVLASGAGTLALTLFGRWIERQAPAQRCEFIPFIADVAALEHALPDLRDTYQPERASA